jgi:hypothetical protein
MIHEEGRFEMAFFQPLQSHAIAKFSSWTMIHNFLSLCRQFAAVYQIHSPSSLSFLRPLQGLEALENNSNNSIVESPLPYDPVKASWQNGGCGAEADPTSLQVNSTPLGKLEFQESMSSQNSLRLQQPLQPLNEMQQVAVRSFMNSMSGSITIIQG